MLIDFGDISVAPGMRFRLPLSIGEDDGAVEKTRGMRVTGRTFLGDHIM